MLERDLPMPDVGAEGRPIRFVQWLADCQMEVVAGDRVAEVVTDGVLIYLSAPWNGRFVEQWAAPDAVVRPGDRLGRMELDEADET